VARKLRVEYSGAIYRVMSRGDRREGDSLTAAGWARLIEAAGFERTDVLLRHAHQVILVAQKEK